MNVRKGIHRHSKQPQAKAIYKLDRALSDLVRSHYLPLGECMDGCGIQIKSVNDADAGHFRRRECMSTRFDLRNLILQARKCNRFDGGRPYETSLAIDKLWGNGTAQELERASHKTVQWPVSELDQLAGAAQHSWLAYLTLYDELIQPKLKVVQRVANST